MKKTPKGFTLIELLVVLGIIAILAAIVVVSFNSSRIKSRDSQRVHDIQQIRTALELYYNRNRAYPTLLIPGQAFSDNSTIYIDPVPSNPSPRSDGACVPENYVYTPSLDRSNYSLTFCLEHASGSLEPGFNTCDNNNSCTAFAFDSTATDLFARFSAVPSDADKHYINSLIVSAKGHGWWDKMDAFYMFAIGTNSTDAKLNWKSTSYTASGSPTWTAYRGFTGNGSSTYLNTNYNPFANGVNYTLNSASSGIYSLSNISASTVEMGASTGGLANRIEFALRFGASAYIAINDNASSQAVSDSRGMWIGSRTAANSFFVTRNGTVLFSPNTASTDRANFNIYIGAMNTGGVAAYHSAHQIAAAFISGGLSATEASVLSNDINTYMTAIGANTY